MHFFAGLFCDRFVVFFSRVISKKFRHKKEGTSGQSMMDWVTLFIKGTFVATLSSSSNAPKNVDALKRGCFSVRFTWNGSTHVTSTWPPITAEHEDTSIVMGDGTELFRSNLVTVNSVDADGPVWSFQFTENALHTFNQGSSSMAYDY